MKSRNSILALLTLAASGLLIACSTSYNQADSNSQSGENGTGFRNPAQDHAGPEHDAKDAVAVVEDDDEDGEESDSISALDPRRGNPWEYDAGAPKKSKWVELYGSAPNYRQIGRTVMGSRDEKFRWVFGPMWYRGRLGKNEVKAFIVGQEGAQDENLTNRAFTGSTGTKTQSFLNHIGINRSYLFMNTFVYTINGQLTEKDAKGQPIKNPDFDWLEQSPESPIVQYRHKLFDNMLNENRETLSLLMGVGAGGKASLSTWLKSQGVSSSCSFASTSPSCPVEIQRKLNTTKPVLVIGVPHPGGASPRNGGTAALQNIIRGFTKAANDIAAFKVSNPDWLPFDEFAKGENAEKVMARMKEQYKYKNAPVPFRDFAFGTNWRMGHRGTSSNRDGTDSIQVFSESAEYNAKGTYQGDPKDVVMSPSKYMDFRAGDLMWEPPRFFADDASRAQSYDYGPCGEDATGAPVASCKASALLGAFPTNDKIAAGIRPKSHASFGNLIGAYRGTFNNPKLVILADQESHDDLFSGRALTGEGGQRLQTWIEATGAMPNTYLILKSLPYDTLGMSADAVRRLALSEGVLRAHKALLKEVLKSGVTFVTVGPIAKMIADRAATNANMGANSKTVKKINLDDSLTRTNWKDALLKLAPQADYPDTPTAIPRMDLPYHSRWWMGTAGSRAARGSGSTDCTNESGCNFYRVWAPRSVSRINPPSLDEETITYLKSKNRFKAIPMSRGQGAQ